MTKLNPFGKTSTKEYAYDESGNIYERSIFSDVWFVSIEKKHVYNQELYKTPKTREIKILKQKNDFYWGVDKKGGYWKRYKYCNWKKMEFKNYEKETIKQTKVVYADTESYMTKGKGINGDLIKRDFCFYKKKQEIRNCILSELD